MAGQHVEASAAFSAAFDRMMAMGRDRTEKAGHAAEQLGAGAIPAGTPAGSRTAVPPRGGHRQRRRHRRQRLADAADEPGASRAGAGPRRGSDSDRRAGRCRGRRELATTWCTCSRCCCWPPPTGSMATSPARAICSRSSSVRSGSVACRRVTWPTPRWRPSRRCWPRPGGDLASRRPRPIGRWRLPRPANRAATCSPGRWSVAPISGWRGGRPAAATADARRALALELEKAEPGSVTSVLGRAYLSPRRGARARRAMTAGAKAALIEALRHLEGSVGAGHPDTLRARALLAALPPS